MSASAFAEVRIAAACKRGGDQAAKMPGAVKYDFEVTRRTNPRVKVIRRGVNPTGRGLCIPLGQLKLQRRC